MSAPTHPSHGPMNVIHSPSRHFPQFICALLWLASGLAAIAVELTDTPKVTLDGSRATVVWKTDVDCGTRLTYGTSADALKQKVEGPVSSTHSVTIEPLNPGTTYYFSVGSARQKLATGSFTTTGTGSTTAPAPTVAKPAPAKPEKKSLPALDPTPPPTRQTWGNLQSLVDHYERHGKDFRATSPDDYAAKAWLFLQHAKAGSWPMKLDDEDGTVRVWNGQTGSFAAYNSDGRTKTYFKPGNPSYWQRQPGRPIKPAQLPFK